MERTIHFTSFLFITTLLFPSLCLSKPVHPNGPNHCFQDDQNALLKIKYHWDNSTLFSTWTPGSDCCRWSGVACKKHPKKTTYRVNFLEVNFGDDIVGTIPSTISDLPYLETLIIRGNPNLTGSIPSSITKLTNLDFVPLNYSSLTGPIPNFFSKLTKLVTLCLNDNRLTGSIPSYFGQLPNLKALDLSYNPLCGPIPTAGRKLQGFNPSWFEHNKCLCGAPLSAC